MPKGIYLHKGHLISDETKKKMSLIAKGKRPYLMTDEIRRKMSKSRKGKKHKPHSKETKKRIGLANKGRKHSDEYKENCRKKRLGIKMTEETKRKISKANKGIKFTEEHKRNIGNSKRGENCTFWQGGVFNNPYPEEWINDLRESIRIRNNYICQECGIHQDELIGFNKKLDIHHIDYNKDNCSLNNLITLCRKCHVSTNSNRNYWIKHFNNYAV